jgi:hypothetical protein
VTLATAAAESSHWQRIYAAERIRALGLHAEPGGNDTALHGFFMVFKGVGRWREGRPSAKVFAVLELIFQAWFNFAGLVVGIAVSALWKQPLERKTHQKRLRATQAAQSKSRAAKSQKISPRVIGQGCSTCSAPPCRPQYDRQEFVTVIVAFVGVTGHLPYLSTRISAALEGLTKRLGGKK